MPIGWLIKESRRIGQVLGAQTLETQHVADVQPCIIWQGWNYVHTGQSTSCGDPLSSNWPLLTELVNSLWQKSPKIAAEFPWIPHFQMVFFCWKRGIFRNVFLHCPKITGAKEWPPLPPPVDWRRLRYKAGWCWISGVDWLKNLKNSGKVNQNALFGESKSLSSS